MTIVNAENIYFKTTVAVIKGKLQSHNYLVTLETEIPGGWQIRVSTGSIINVLHNGKVTLQGKPDADIKEILGFLRN